MLKKLFIVTACLLATSCSTVHNADEADTSAPVTQGGDVDTYHTGMRYLTGRGVPQNNSTAVYWFEKSAADGNPYAESELGYLYTVGKGVQQDYGMAIQWYQKAAHRGLASAQYNLALLYANGLGTPVNKAIAHQLFLQAAQRGFDPARRALAND
jgi:TPR repeat protein